MGELEGIGEAVTGGLLARAVEPEAGEASDDGHTHEQCCLNCGIVLVGPYCAACGQKAHVHRSLRAFGGDFVTGLFNFEGKFWRTLPMLAWRPGDLTRRYIEGERARFISPVALYLFSVFLMFATLSFTGMDAATLTSNTGGLEQGEIDQRAKVTRLEERRAAAAARGEPTAALDAELKEERDDLANIVSLRRGGPIVVQDPDDDTPQWARHIARRAAANPQATVGSVQDAASKYSWLLIPLSLPFMWLLFPFSRRFRMYDHSVFITYSLSFMMMLVIVGGLLVAAGWNGLAGMLFLVPPFHMYRQLKGAYRLGRFNALLRTSLLLTFSFVAIVLFAVAIAAIGVL